MIDKGVILPLLLAVAGMALLGSSVRSTAATTTVVVHNQLTFLLGCIFLFGGMLFPFWEDDGAMLLGWIKKFLRRR